jgi:hypothetical protein
MSTLPPYLLVAGWKLAYVPAVTVRHGPSPRRDVGRRRDLARNAVQIAWLRRSLPSALALTLRHLAAR